MSDDSLPILLDSLGLTTMAREHEAALVRAEAEDLGLRSPRASPGRDRGQRATPSPGCFGLPRRGKTLFLAAFCRELMQQHQLPILYTTAHRVVIELLIAKRGHRAQECKLSTLLEPLRRCPPRPIAGY